MHERDVLRGFTLIEMIVVVAIIGIVAAIAIPRYNDYVIRANRKAAQATLLDIANRQRQYFVDARRFFDTAQFAALGFTVPEDVSKHYDVTVTVVPGPPPEFTATAAPRAGSKQAADGTLVVDHRGTKTRDGSPTSW